MNILINILVIIGGILSLFNLPGTFVITGSVLLDIFLFGNTNGKLAVFIVYLILSIIGTFIDNLFMLWGAQKYGASKWGMIGVVVGVLVGLITANPVLIIVGPFMFAYLFESVIANKDHDAAVKSVKGSVIGGISGYVVKTLLALFMALFYLLVIR